MRQPKALIEVIVFPLLATLDDKFVTKYYY